MPADVVGLYQRFGVTIRPPREETDREWVTVRCFVPGHQDRHASARINLRSGGFKCFACMRRGGALDALQILGVWDRQEARRYAVDYGILEPPRRPPKPRPAPAKIGPPPPAVTPPPSTANPVRVAGRVDWDKVTSGPTTIHERTWIYTDANGDPVGRVHRLDLADGTKRIWQERPDGTGWSPGLEGKHLPLYRLPHVLEHAAAGHRILIVEGEKACDALDKLGFFATTNAGGAGKWRDEHTHALHGATVQAVSDCDLPGRLHAIHLSSECLQAGETVLAPLDPAAERNDGFDIVDHLEQVANTIRGSTDEIPTDALRARLRNHLHELLAGRYHTDSGDLQRRLEHAQYTANPDGYAYLVCERCRRRRVHRITHGLAYCPCGTHQLIS